MCGILAIFCNNNQEQLELIQDAYNNVIIKRGPDRGKLIIETKYIIGFRRLCIVDTTESSDQPFISGDIKMICNGEIYNYKKLEKEYDLDCKSGSDCECIIELYKKIGFQNTINVLDGDFSVVIIDKHKMFFARDRTGVRPLFIGRTNNDNIAVASVARALSSYCKWVKQLEPVINYYDSKLDRIFTFKHYFPSYFSDGGNIYNNIQQYLIKSVEKRIMSDRPICCMLSGGLDSSLIASILCKLIGPKNVRTYSIGMNGSTDLKYAKIVADYLGTQHTEVLFTPDEGFAAIPQIITDIETYDITTIRASVGMWLLSKYISENSDDIVILTGEGSDELFMGYLYFHNAPNASEANIESKRLVNQLYLYDVLRADRCISVHGLEPRVPFLDKKFIDFVLSISGDFKIPINGIEKFTLRKSFETGFLPNEVLWRRKDGFSDGVSGSNKKWYEQIQDFVENIITNEEFELVKNLFPNKEAYYYKKIYDEIFPLSYRPVIDYWLPKWTNHGGNPSGRIISIYEEKTHIQIV
jgi:asparagine synthase (glutamine-hydrolysing)